MLWQTLQFLVHAGTRMIVDSCYSSGAGSEFHVDGPATAKLRGPYRFVRVTVFLAEILKV